MPSVTRGRLSDPNPWLPVLELVPHRWVTSVGLPRFVALDGVKRDQPREFVNLPAALSAALPGRMRSESILAEENRHRVLTQLGDASGEDPIGRKGCVDERQYGNRNSRGRELGEQPERERVTDACGPSPDFAAMTSVSTCLERPRNGVTSVGESWVGCPIGIRSVLAG
jgi:hypothetical protein